jgi:hypothetical protein
MTEDKIGPNTNWERTMEIRYTAPTTIKASEKYLPMVKNRSFSDDFWHLAYEKRASTNPAAAMYMTRNGEKNPIIYSIRDTMGNIKNAIT